MFKTLQFLSLIFLFLHCSQPPNYRFEANQLIIKEGEVSYYVSAVTDQVIRVAISDTVRNYAPVIYTPIEVEIKETSSGIRLMTSKVAVDITLNPVSFEYIDLQSGSKLKDYQGFYSSGDTLGVNFLLSESEAIYGTGSRPIPLNRRGRKLMIYNQPQYGYSYGAENINFTIPHVYSSNQYMLLVDNPAKAWMDIDSQSDGVLDYKALGGNMVYYFINGNSFEELIGEYTTLTGKQPLPPMWMFGNLHSRFGYHSREEAEESLNAALNSGYPVDAIIFDIYWFGPELEDGQMGRLDWDLDKWPEPSSMIEEINKKDVRVITVSEPFFTLKSGRFENLADMELLAKDSSGQAATIPDFYFGEAGLLDIYKPEAQGWIWNEYKRMKSYGVEGWWVDLGEPEKHPDYMYHVNGAADEVHGVYGHFWAKMLFEGYRRDFPTERLLHLGRSGFAGTQRFSLIPWSGDISRSWSGLKAQLPIMLGMGLSGYGYMHSDAGGFSNVPEGDSELYIRWLQFATFTPVFRPHADEIVPSEPIFWPEDVQEIVKPTIRLRYELLPYNYTIAWENKTTGMPMARPLFTEYKNIPDTIEDQYMWGGDMMVAPILEKGQTKRRIYLPEGKWYEMGKSISHMGGEWMEVETRLESIPVYVKEGSIIPRVTGLKRSIEYPFSDKLELDFYGDTNGQTLVYYDDGVTPDAFEKGLYQLVEINVSAIDDVLNISVNKKGDGYKDQPKARQFRLNIHSELIKLNDQTNQNFTIKDNTLFFSFKNDPINLQIPVK